MKDHKLFKALIIVVFFIDIVFAARHFGGYGYDINCFIAWATHILNNGLSKAYTVTEIKNSYMPFNQYFLYLFAKLAGSVEAIKTDIGYIKGITLFFDFLGLWYVYKWIDKKMDFLLLLLVNILNPGFCYNTLIWGQLDGMFCAMSFISLYYAYNNKIALSAICYVIALNMKLQAIIVMPVLGLTWLYWLIDRRDIKPFVYAILAAIVMQLLFLLPFLGHEDGVPLLWKEVTGSFNLWNWIGVNDFWTFVVPNGGSDKDTGIFVFGLTFKQSGLILFSLFAFIALWPMMHVIYRRIVKGVYVSLPKRETYWLMCALMGLVFYFFNTEMHERYSHIALLFITAYAFYTRNYIPWILYTFVYFLILEDGQTWLGLKNYDAVIFQEWFIAGGFAVIIVYLYVLLYRRAFKERQPALAE